MSDVVIQGVWDDRVTRHDFRGRRVRVIAIDDDRDDAWIKSFGPWADSHRTLGHTVGDSRESMRSGTADDPR